MYSVLIKVFTVNFTISSYSSECVKGQWVCTEVQCEARCAAVGDPHYQTFDGRRYNFMGKCSYYLLQTENYTVDAENVACDGRISEVCLFTINSGVAQWQSFCPTIVGLLVEIQTVSDKYFYEKLDSVTIGHLHPLIMTASEDQQQDHTS